ncbi:hypothetical protein [Nostoc sp. ChiQUE01b]|uniref:hypothetical protein n=1 Tax=Nostoc sp. ChiQUE01b TaxID=3075376 RepID=UPI002AD2222A|nr:hypothetical protein [Nostoc sp. ChiQUE01b]MDZ8262885.1 hypothetical protein [Nostoc sp. ChiQUE01b]
MTLVKWLLPGTTGMAIIRAIVAGETDPQILAAKRHHRTKRSETEIAAALNGDYRNEHIFVLQQELQLYDVYQAQIAACDRQIQECLAQLARAILPSRAFYRRLRSRLGTPKAITATAHKLARIFYRLWTTGGNYQDIGMDYYEQRYQERVINNLQKKALALGFELVPQPEANTVS